jgi:predicted metal-dependent peptidase
MAREYEPKQRARGKIELCIERLVEKYPFHARILERFKIAARPEVGTMGVTVSGNDVLLLHNPDFVLNTPSDELTGVLLHETHHVLFNHVLADPADYPDHWARTVAEEVTVNEFVKEPLPAGGITLKDFPDLPPMESTDQRYARLKRKGARLLISTPRDQASGGGGAGQTAQQAGQGTRQDKQTAQRTKDGTKNRKTKGRRGDAGGRSIGVTADDHTVWQEAQKDPNGAKAAIENVIQEAALEVGMNQVPEQFQEIVGGTMAGDTPGEDQYELQGDEQGQLEWRRLLRRYVGQVLQVRPIFSRPPRRFPDLVGIVPGKGRLPDRPKIMAVIDTSGSITSELLELIDAELAGLARHHAVKVVECDCEIHAVYDYRRPLKNVTGRGGTDFRPPLEAKFLRKHRPDLIIYFTDGLGPAPDKSPRVPLIWCLTPEGEAPVDWGKKIQMEDP